MQAETRNCQNCKIGFIIEPEDFSFYQKIDVPPPTWCAWCRMQRRMSWIADSTTLYERRCRAPGHDEKIFSIYPDTASPPVYDYKFWASDGWDGLAFGKKYDFSRTFFEQYKEFLDSVPVRSTEIVNSIDSEYCLGVTDSKNCYLCGGTFGSENCIYGRTAVFSKDCIDVTLSTYVEGGYDLFSVDKSFQITSSVYSDELVSCDFMYDCRGCSDCLGCVGLRNKKYCIFNRQYSKEEYKKERLKYDLGSYKTRSEVRERHQELLLKYPRKYAVTRNAVNCTGDNLINSKNCKYMFQALNDVENCKYGFVAGYGAKDSQDIAGAGLKSQLLYDVASVIVSEKVAFSSRIRNSYDVQYSRECFDSEHLFACAGLKSKKYCIFNIQYSKEEYELLRKSIIEQMNVMPYIDKQGRVYRYGEFPPSSHSLFPYNSSWAMQQHFSETQETASRKGFWWYIPPERVHAVTMQNLDIPDHVTDAQDSLTDEIIECPGGTNRCPGVFRIISQELQFYKKFNIALPRFCHFCRFSKHLEYFTPYKLWRRKCLCGSSNSLYSNTRAHSHGDNACQNQFETAYAPERLELLYCESCYNAEIL